MNGFIWFFLGVLTTVILSFLVLFYRHRYHRKRLEALTSYLEAASCGKETVLCRIEDDFSLLEDEIYKTVSELRIAREEAQKARKKQADNLADIAHQLKTPLTSMSLMVQLLLEDVSPEQKEYVMRLENQLTRLVWLTDSLLTMSRLDAGAVDFVPEELTFEELAARATEPIEELLRERHQTVHINGKHTLVSCDPYWTCEALVNLMKNCSEHTPEFGAIIVTASQTALYQQITVEDSGPGFDPEELPHLFVRFFKGKHSSKDSIGIGIGLALSRAIVEEQGGILRAENRKEGGARFLLRLYL